MNYKKSLFLTGIYSSFKVHSRNLYPIDCMRFRYIIISYGTPRRYVAGYRPEGGGSINRNI